MVYKILTIGVAAMLALTGCASDDLDQDNDRINIEAPAKERGTEIWENQAGEGVSEVKPSGKSLKREGSPYDYDDDRDDDWDDDDWDDDDDDRDDDDYDDDDLDDDDYDDDDLDDDDD